MSDSTPPESRPLWHHPTPGSFLIGVVLAQVFLLLSEQFSWFRFNEMRGWTVLIAVAVVCGAILFMLLWLGVSLLFRWRFQFSLRTLLLFVVVVAIPCSWFSVKMQQARRQREAVKALEKGGGVRYCLYKSLFNGGYPRDPPGRLRPSWLRNLVGADFLSDVVEIEFSRGSDVRLVHLEELTSLEDVYFHGTQVSYEGAQRFLRALPKPVIEY